MSIDTHSISSGSSSALYEKDDTDIRTRHFLCIPVRYSLLSCSALLFLVASAFFALGASLAHSASFRKLSDDIERITVILHVAAFGIASLIALLGIYAAIARSIKLCNLFICCSLGQLLLSIGSGVLSLYLLYGPNSKDTGTNPTQNVCNDDEQGSEETDVDCACQGQGMMSLELFVGLFIALFAASCILQLTTLYLSHRYRSQRREELAHIRASGLLWRLKKGDSVV